MPRIATVVALPAVLLVSSLVVAGQEKPAKNIWDGVFTQAQVDHGKHVFEEHCATCHGPDLTGADGPSLVGGNFGRNWGSRYLDRLFKKIQTRMPADDVQSVSDKDKVDIVAFMLASNGFPAGKQDLPLSTDVLGSIQIVGRNGPEPAPAGAMVEILGCLTGEGKEWKLTNATEPAVSTMDDPEADAIAAAKRSLGKETVALLDIFPSPAEHKGHKMLAKGLLIRNNGLALNVLHLGLVGTTCAP